MASARITELEDMAVDGRGYPVPIADLPPLAEQNITYTTSTASAALQKGTRYVRIDCSATGHIAVGTAPAATADSLRIQADTPEYFGIDGSKGDLKIAIYDGSS